MDGRLAGRAGKRVVFVKAEMIYSLGSGLPMMIVKGRDEEEGGRERRMARSRERKREGEQTKMKMKPGKQPWIEGRVRLREKGSEQAGSELISGWQVGRSDGRTGPRLNSINRRTRSLFQTINNMSIDQYLEFNRATVPLPLPQP